MCVGEGGGVWLDGSAKTKEFHCGEYHFCCGGIHGSLTPEAEDQGHLFVNMLVSRLEIMNPNKFRMSRKDRYIDLVQLLD